MKEPHWYRALTLSERLPLREEHRESRKPATRVEHSPSARRRLREWRSQTPFQDEEWFARRLEFDGLTEEELLDLLDEPAAPLCERLQETPAWLVALADGLAAGDDAGSPAAYSALTEAQPVFAVIVAPLLQRAFDRVLERAEELAGAPGGAPLDPEETVRWLFAGLLDQVDGMLSRTVVLEMRVASLDGELPGNTRGERFRRFIERLAETQPRLAFFREYPLLARLIAERLELWIEASSELLGRLCEDWPQICATFSPARDPGRLEKISGGMGDLHRRGRAVRILRFSKGLSLVYKPRSLAVDVEFGELLAWLSERGAPELRSVRVLDRGPYGWSELVVPESCTAVDAIRRFYHRQGAFLALLYALNANDFHRENLIAAGEHPMLIDLESLCGADYGLDDPAAHESMADYVLFRSVKRVMLLPYLRQGAEGREFIDPSGLGGGGEQVSVSPVPTWENAQTDEMRLVRQRTALPTADNQPLLSGETVDPLDFAEEIVGGFVRMYRVLLRHRGELLGGATPLARLAGSEVRAIFRATAFYAFILRESHHPDLLRDALDRERLFDRLWYGFDRTKFPEISMRLLRYEREDLWRGDIPFFTHFPATHEVITGSGRRLADFHIHSGWEMVRTTLERFGEEHLEEQVFFIRSSLTTLEMSTRPKPIRYVLSREPIESSRESLLAGAAAVAARLGELARLNGEGASWLGLSLVRDHGWQLRSLDTDLYSGLPGVALFLAYFGEICGCERSVRLAEGALATLRGKLEWRRKKIKAVGGFDGWGGLIYTWTHLGVLWRRNELVDEALDTLGTIEALIAEDVEYDVMRGAAGAISPLLALYRATGSEKALAVAREMGDWLIARAEPQPEGVGWLGAACPIQALTGFSHGAAGIVWSLAELYAATGEDTYRRTALAGLAFENSLFSAEKKNWPDLRGGTNLDEEWRMYMASWCHGAGGVGRGRLRMRRHLDESVLVRDARAAVETTMRLGFGENHCLCHGDLGNLELLQEASRDLDEGTWHDELTSRISLMLASIDEHGWLCGVPLAVETPGLMNGLSGIGHGMLRLAEPDRVPSISLLDPPPDRASTA